jgi:iron complex outermembrane recepter protein
MTARRQGWRTLATLIGLLLAGGSWPAVARDMSGPSTVIPFEIPAGDFVDQVGLFAKQSGMSVLYKFEGVQELKTQPVSGNFTPAEALERMLRGTGIVPEFVKRQTVTLKRASAAGPEASIGTGRRGSSVKRNLQAWEPTDRRGAQVTNQEVIVTGQLPSEFHFALAQPRITLDRNDIDATGLATVPDVIRTQPQVFGGGPSEDTHEIGDEARTNAGRGYGVNLRALGAGSSLVLLNGRRLAASGSEGAFVDVSNVPFQAVQEIDIVPESSSTRYGADAVGGTVNFVMRDRFDGALATAHFGSTTTGDVGENYVSQLFGGQTASGHGLISLDFYSRGHLAASRRPQVTSNLSRFGGSDFDQPLANPGTIFAGGLPWAIPANQDGTHLDPTTLVAGTQNRADKFQGADVLPNQQRWSIFGTWTNALTGRASLFADTLISNRSVRAAGTAAAGNFGVPDSNPFYVNPAGAGPVTVAYSFAKDLGSTIGEGEVNTRSIATGLDLKGSSWHSVLTAGYASERLSANVLNTVDRGAVDLALADTNPATALNLFGDGSHNNPVTLDKLRTSSLFESHSYVKSLNLSAEAPVRLLPGGDLTVLIGADYREQTFTSATRQTSSSPAIRQGSDRSVSALFAEATVPLWGNSNRMRALQSLELSFGARYESYSDFGNVVTPRYGLRWSPVRGLAFRSSWARSFRAPSLIDMDESQNATQFAVLPDPSAAEGHSGVLLWAGKNADLREETARSWTVGFDLTPPGATGLSFATTYFDIDFTDRLNTPFLSGDLLSNPTFADLVIRNPSAAQLSAVCSRAPNTVIAGSCTNLPVAAIVDLRVRNDASMHTRGFDVIGKYVREMSLGTVSIGLNGTYIIDFAEAKSHGLPLQERVSTQNYPIDLKLRGALGWRRGGWGIDAFVNFSDHYRDTASTPERSVDHLTTIDLNVAYTVSGDGGAWLGNTTLALSGENLLNRDPPFLNNAVGVGYDEENADIIGRFVSFTIRRSW